VHAVQRKPVRIRPRVSSSGEQPSMIEMPHRKPSLVPRGWYAWLQRQFPRQTCSHVRQQTRSILPPRLQAFHLPGSCGDFMSGDLRVSGPGRLLFPTSPVSTTVRTLPVAGDRILWVRSFAGKTVIQSTYRHSAASNEQPLHDVEYLFPLSFQFDWTDPSVVVDGTRVSPKHIGTRLLDVLPLPLGLVSVRLEMIMLDDSSGWDLVADVRLLGTRQLICYEGTMRELTSSRSEEKEEGNERALPPKYVPTFHTLVLFDGECNLCNFSVDFAMRRDYQQRLVFAPQQSQEATEALRKAGHEPPAAINSGVEGGGEGGASGDSVLVLSPDGGLHERSGAAMRVGLVLDWPWPWLAALGFLIPAAARDAIYDLVGRHRYKWFGKRDTCRRATANERRRFL